MNKMYIYTYVMCISTETCALGPALFVNKAQLEITSTNVAENPPCKPPKTFVCDSLIWSSPTHVPLPADTILT